VVELVAFLAKHIFLDVYYQAPNALGRIVIKKLFSQHDLQQMLKASKTEAGKYWVSSGVFLSNVTLCPHKLSTKVLEASDHGEDVSKKSWGSVTVGREISKKRTFCHYWHYSASF